MSDRILS